MKEIAFLLRVFVEAVLRVVLPAVFGEARKSMRDTAEEAQPQPELKARLQRRIRSRWRTAATTALLAFVCLAGTGCGTRTVFIPEGDPVRLRKPIKKAPVWVMDKDGTPVAATTRLEAGWYVLSDPGVEAGDKAKADSAPPVEPAPFAPVPLSAPVIPVVPATPAPYVAGVH